MYHLATSVWANFTRKQEYAVVILGLDNAGKTTLLEQIKRQAKSRHGHGDQQTAEIRTVPTVGQNVSKIRYRNLQLKFWDLGGQESLRAMWEKYYAQSNAVIFVVDSTDRPRLEDCCRELERICSSDVLAGIPILMLANKQDRDECLEVEDIKEIFNKVVAKMEARDSRVLPVCALDGTGLEDATEWLVSRMERNKQLRPPNLV